MRFEPYFCVSIEIKLTCRELLLTIANRKLANDLLVHINDDQSDIIFLETKKTSVVTSVNVFVVRFWYFTVNNFIRSDERVIVSVDDFNREFQAWIAIHSR